jgi:monosaccharide ABC transporter substrate-binding protein, CUT2 family (TC 3.A.1.2.-)
MMSYWKS